MLKLCCFSLLNDQQIYIFSKIANLIVSSEVSIPKQIHISDISQELLDKFWGLKALVFHYAKDNCCIYAINCASSQIDINLVGIPTIILNVFSTLALVLIILYRCHKKFSVRNQRIQYLYLYYVSKHFQPWDIFQSVTSFNRFIRLNY